MASDPNPGEEITKNKCISSPSSLSSIAGSVEWESTSTVTSNHLLDQFVARYKDELRMGEFQSIIEEKDKLENEVSRLKDNVEELKFEASANKEIIDDQEGMLARVEGDYTETLAKLVDSMEENKKLKEEVETLKSAGTIGRCRRQSLRKLPQTEMCKELSDKLGLLVKTMDTEVDRKRRLRERRTAGAAAPGKRRKPEKDTEHQSGDVVCVDLTQDDDQGGSDLTGQELSTVGSRSETTKKTALFRLIGYVRHVNAPNRTVKSKTVDATWQFSRKPSGRKIMVFRNIPQDVDFRGDEQAATEQSSAGLNGEANNER